MRWLSLLVVVTFALSLTGVALAQSPSPTASPSPAPSQTPVVSTPAPAPTPWPAPLGLELTQSINVTNPDGSFIPPDKRTAASSLTWAPLSGFTGTYVLERSRAAYGDPVPGLWEAFAWVAGAWFIEEPFPFLELLSLERCYRVRTLVNGELGPSSNEVCTIKPPTTGPENLSTPPGPPDTGNLGPPAEPAGAASFVALGAISVALSVLLALATALRHRRP